ncbi:3-oxoacyl-[acyl-carrier-protein] synthase III C-terminal domain-containing protein, partial [Lentilactobacillus parabuchneri]|uniref:3-oxoacyl-[acyl-carrier-protein] synthase III C-terminal domain-containing protein n=1 Tax=Lentilactobacillus parabuchneri TaxID=152331 RepID=UPI0026485890
PMSKFPVNINEYGNTSAASEPILLAELVAKKIIKRGDVIALSGFGGGLTVGTIIIKY